MLTDILETKRIRRKRKALGTGLYYLVQGKRHGSPHLIIVVLPAGFLFFGYIIDYFRAHHHSMLGYLILYGQAVGVLLIGILLIILMRSVEKDNALVLQ